MNNLVLTLTGGAGLMLVVFHLLWRVARVNGRFAAGLTTLAALAAYLGWAVVRWPGADVVAIHVAVFAVLGYVLGIVAGQRERQRREGRRWFHWGPAALVAFFLVVLAADALFVMVAQQGLGPEWTRRLLPEPRSGGRVQSFFPGTVARDYQKREAEYNAYLARVREQQARGWRVRKGWLDRPVAGRPGDFQVEVRDREGRPVYGARVHGTFMWPADKRRDVDFTLEPVGPGLYRGVITLPRPGRWELLLLIEKDDAVHEIKARTRVADAGG